MAEVFCCGFRLFQGTKPEEFPRARSSHSTRTHLLWHCTSTANCYSFCEAVCSLATEEDGLTDHYRRKILQLKQDTMSLSYLAILAVAVKALLRIKNLIIVFWFTSRSAVRNLSCQGEEAYIPMLSFRKKIKSE